VLEPQSLGQLQKTIVDSMRQDSKLLNQLRDEIRPLRPSVRRIMPRSSTSISLVGADGGNNRLRFDPFLVQLVRVVDSSNNEYCLEAITPTTSVAALSERQFGKDGHPATALGKMMELLGVRNLTELSQMIRSNDDDRPTSASWVQVYRELVEWAILFSIVRDKEFATDTLIVVDGLLRSKAFARDLFKRYLEGLEEAIERHARHSRRKLYLVGVAKHSKVLYRYRLAMSLEGILTTNYPAYLEIPREIEEKAYLWAEYARGDDREVAETEINKFVGGKMFFVKFGSGTRDPIWPVDIFLPQVGDTQAILGCMLSDAINGFPVPFYPRCLQEAHENAALVDFDMDILQDQIFAGLREVLGGDAPQLDVFRLQDSDPAQRRYG